MQNGHPWLSWISAKRPYGTCIIAMYSMTWNPEKFALCSIMKLVDKVSVKLNKSFQKKTHLNISNTHTSNTLTEPFGHLCNRSVETSLSASELKWPM